MKFSKSRTKDLPADIKLDDVFLEVKNELKIFWAILTSDLCWESDTEYICKKEHVGAYWALESKDEQIKPSIVLPEGNDSPFENGFASMA